MNGFTGDYQVETVCTVEDFDEVADAWDRLAVRSASPFLTSAWITAWWTTAPHQVSAVILRDGSGALAAGVTVHRRPHRGWSSAADVHSGEWGVVAASEHAAVALWRELAIVARRSGRLELRALPASARDDASSVLRREGYRLIDLDYLDSPVLQLPPSYDLLLARVSRNLRSQLGRSRRALAELGPLQVTVAEEAPSAMDAVERFLQLEVRGWKGREGTSVLSVPRTTALYRRFARGALDRGALRVVLVELDGHLVAADLSCRVGDRMSLIKTAYDETHAPRRPGLVLRAEALRLAIAEGCHEYDFLGAPDQYKTRWRGDLRRRHDLVAVRGVWCLESLYRQSVRPRLAHLRRRVRS
jgi:CelD/BcsL family acetyltransferase involved in cellulose biosynthesis